MMTNVDLVARRNQNGRRRVPTAPRTHALLVCREATRTPKCGAECDGVCASFRAREVVERAAHSSEVDAPMSYLNQPCAC